MAALVAISACAQGSDETTVLEFVLPRDATTSAGLYDADGRLLRTLWSGERLVAGRHRRSVDASGLPEHLRARLIHHNVQAVWEGVIGNSSSNFTGPGVHRSFLVPSGLAFGGPLLYVASGYNEGQLLIRALHPRDPQRALQPIADFDPFVAIGMLAADAQRLYALNTGGGLSRTTFVIAYDLATGRQVDFAEGRPLCLNRRPNSDACYENQDYRSVIDHGGVPDDVPTGIAVQQGGPLLAVARPARAAVLLFDKRSGRALGRVPLERSSSQLQQIAFAPNGDLWLLGRDRATRWRWDGHQATPIAQTGPLRAPLAIAVHPGDEDAVWIALGDRLHQIHRFDRHGTPVATLGRAFTYDTDPTVADDRLCFRAQGDTERTALAVEIDGSIWVVDTCNHRIVHFDVAGRPASKVAYLPVVYVAAADPHDATRVFANFLEFRVDPEAPLAPGMGWTLVRNWWPGLPRELRDRGDHHDGFAGLRTVVTVTPGVTMAQVAAGDREAIVQLPREGPLRTVRQLAPPQAGATRKVLNDGGDLVWAQRGLHRQSVLRQRFTGLSASAEPQWSAEAELLASVPVLPGSPVERGAFAGPAGPRFPITASGEVVLFDGSVVGNDGFHLGAVRLGDTRWSWMASDSGAIDGKGRFQTRASDPGVQYGGNLVMAHGRHVVYGYHGEFYRDRTNGRVGQAGQFMHFLDNGLFVQQFGVPTTRVAGEAAAGVAGNAFSPSLVRAGRRLFLYHNDESVHGGVHRWRIEGWDDVVELTGRGRRGELLQLLRPENAP